MTSLPFSTFALSEPVKLALAAMGFENASPIQAQTIPSLMQGLDVIGQAQTGTGKTAAFAIPLIEKIDTDNRAIQALVLCPTRELAVQVTEEFGKLSQFKSGFMALSVYGGQPIQRQINLLKRKPQMIVGTPGRVLDLIRRGVLKLHNIKMVVLDEADEMLNMGFRADIESILERTHARDRQTVLFSATMPQAILDLTAAYQRDAVHIKVEPEQQSIAQVEQSYIELHRKSKSDALLQLLRHHQFGLSLVFCNTQQMVDVLVDTLRREGFSAEGLHGGIRQDRRDAIMRNFRSGKTTVLIATNVAARGIDVKNIEAVFNYDLPKDLEFYIHRVGRTGRAGSTGKAFTFIEKSDYRQLKKIRNSPNVNISRLELPASA